MEHTYSTHSRIRLHLCWQTIYIFMLWFLNQRLFGYFLYTVSQKKTRHPSHVDNFVKNWSIFKILSLIDSEQNFLQNVYCVAHHTLHMLLHYLVKLQCFKNRINSKIHYRRTLFWSIFVDVPAQFLFLVKLESIKIMKYQFAWNILCVT